MGTRAGIRRGLILVAAMLAILALPASASAYSFPSYVTGGTPELMYDWSTQRCDSNNIPDAPAHAIRDARNNIQVTVTHWKNYRLMGRTFNSLAYSCHELMQSGESGDPATFNNKEWVGTIYTEDGRHVYGLTSNEYQGNLFVGFCASGNYFKCLYLSMSGIVSNNFGDDYVNQINPLVRSSAYQYYKDTGPYGVNQPSNIVKAHDGYYYVMYKADTYLAQVGGACLLRTRNLKDPASWRGWDGHGFNQVRKNPYVVVPMQRAEPFTCHPVDPSAIEGMSHSLTWNTYFKKWLLVGPAGIYDPDLGANRYGFFYSTSDDLIHWSDRKMLVEVPLVTSWVCGQEFPWGFPSVIDQNSHSRSFETSDDSFYLYYTIHNRPGCTQGLDRDLMRIPIKLNSPPP